MTELRARPDRITEETAQRRRRSDTTIDGSQRLKLVIPPAVAERLKAEGRTPYWANDVGNRIEQLTVHDDYDRVDGVEPVTTVIDRKNGETCRTYLLSKPTAFVEEDRAKAEQPRRATEEQLLQGHIPNDSTAGSPDRYVVEGTKITRGGSG